MFNINIKNLCTHLKFLNIKKILINDVKITVLHIIDEDTFITNTSCDFLEVNNSWIYKNLIKLYHIVKHIVKTNILRCSEIKFIFLIYFCNLNSLMFSR